MKNRWSPAPERKIENTTSNLGTWTVSHDQITKHVKNNNNMYLDFLCFEAVEFTTILNCSTNLQTVVFDYEEQSYCVDYTVLTFLQTQ